ncbi:hypothetical protein DYB37_006610 [Aphanomyces astaci]|uniref:Uncharacterized protein n=1 Tax=Aphanomyces astaci TaxID=112090 RepID=A0A397DX46_APHAT|nr:hypothetical protein DYB30_005760 [Aphanomyces astaci]RHY90395.1 hypothetical protein DYB35_004085 [Aphanomyces astaci]RHZ34318.1 hypothetical protein DYB37_006610 [Aphanomyces astaci]RHZ42209.1 hypothetical protein DYB26_001165 [Aphanomyces astaci]
MARPRPKTQAAVMPRKDEDVLEYMKSMAEPKDKRHRPKPSTRSASRNVSTIAKRHRDLQAAFGFGCNVQEHIKFGKVRRSSLKYTDPLKASILRYTLGQTALHVACRVGPVALVRHMLAANAIATPRSYRMDMNTQDNNGNTCLHIAAKANHLDITQCLLDAGIIIRSTV